MKTWLTGLAIVWMGMHGALLRAADEGKEPAPTPTEGSVSLAKDPAFDRYVDLSSLSDAVADMDAATLADLALQLAHGEKILLRPHRSVKAQELFEIALKAAIERRDTATVDRLAKGAEAHGSKELSEHIALAKNLVRSSRSTKGDIKVSLDDLTEESSKSLLSWRRSLDAAKLAGDRKGISELAAESAVLGDFKDGLRKQMKASAEEAIKDLPEGDANPLLVSLKSKKRGFTTTAYYTTPIVNKAPGAVTFYIVGANFKQLFTLAPGQSYTYRIPSAGVLDNVNTYQPGQILAGGYQNVSVQPSIAIALNPTKNARGEYSALATYSLPNGRAVAILYSPQLFPGRNFGTQYQ